MLNTILLFLHETTIIFKTVLLVRITTWTAWRETWIIVPFPFSVPTWNFTVTWLKTHKLFLITGKSLLKCLVSKMFRQQSIVCSVLISCLTLVRLLLKQPSLMSFMLYWLHVKVYLYKSSFSHGKLAGCFVKVHRVFVSVIVKTYENSKKY